MAASICAKGDGAITRLLFAAKADVDGGNPSPLVHAVCEKETTRDCAQLLLEPGATKARTCAGSGALVDQEDIHFIGHQNTDEQRRAVDAMIAAHNLNAHWLLWYHPRKILSIMHHVE